MVLPDMPSAEGTIALRDKLRRVARYHRWLTVSFGVLLGLSLAAAFGVNLEQFSDLPVAGFTFGLLILFLYALMIVSLVGLTKELANVYVAIVCGVVAVAPNLGFFYPGLRIAHVCAAAFLTLLVVFYVWSRRFLKRHDVPIGLFGADPSKIGVKG